MVRHHALTPLFGYQAAFSDLVKKYIGVKKYFNILYFDRMFRKTEQSDALFKGRFNRARLWEI